MTPPKHYTIVAWLACPRPLIRFDSASVWRRPRYGRHACGTPFRDFTLTRPHFSVRYRECPQPTRLRFGYQRIWHATSDPMHGLFFVHGGGWPTVRTFPSGFSSGSQHWRIQGGGAFRAMPPPKRLKMAQNRHISRYFTKTKQLLFRKVLFILLVRP